MVRGVGYELLTLPEHLSSFPVLCKVRVARSLIFFVMLCTLLFVFFLSVILFSVHLRLTTFDHPFEIFKLFLYESI